jgi:pimeloyl-ACP methyl ester carboxylesterase
MNIMPNKTIVILIHGAGLGGYIWDELKPLLTLPSLAIEFPNRKPSEVSNSNLSLVNYIQSTIDQIEKVDFENIIIITHSIGGVVGLKVVEYFGDKVIVFIAITSSVPKNGGSFVSSLPLPQKLILPVIMTLAGTKPPDSEITKGMCSDLSLEQRTKVISNFTPEAKSLYFTKIIYPQLDYPKLYIKTTKDKEFSIDMQNQFAQNLGTQNIQTIDCGHLPMISNTPELANIINQFIKSN